MKILVPELSLVVLVGPSGAGKSTFAKTHFLPTEVISSDFCRGLVSDDENDLSATKDAFTLLHYIAGKRLERGKLTVVDATSVKREDRKPLLDLARKYHVIPVAIVLNMPEELCWERNQGRDDRDFGRHVIKTHLRQLGRSLKYLKKEGFRYVYRFDTPAQLEDLVVDRRPLWNNLKQEHGPFDIIGDVHGCCDELETLLAQLGYRRVATEEGAEPVFRHPDGRKAVFLGDLVDRGPRILDTYELVRSMVEAG
jgi:protein phosphatase